MTITSYNDLANVLTYSDGTKGAVGTGPMLTSPQIPGMDSAAPKSSGGSSRGYSYGSLQGTPGTPPEQPNIIDPVHGAMEDTLGEGAATVIDPVGSVIGAVTGGGKVICTELYSQGLMPENIYRADQGFGRGLLVTDSDAMAGYHLWAPTVVCWMRKSRAVTSIVRAIVMPWARQMAYVMGDEPKGNALGAALMAVGLRVCRVLGRLSSARGRKAAATGAAGV